MLRQISLVEDGSAVHPLTTDNTGNSLRGNRSRLPSLSSLLGSSENGKEEKMGFRRLAKSLLHGDKNSAGKGTELEEVSRGALEDDRDSLRYYETAKSYSLSSSKAANRKIVGDIRNNNSRQSQVSRQHIESTDRDDTLLARLMESNMKIRQETRLASRNSVTTKDAEHDADGAGESRGSNSKQLGLGKKTTSVAGDNALKMNENIVNTTFQLDKKATKDGILEAVMRESRVIMLSNIHCNTSLTSIMSQIYGGPLEKVRLLDKSSLKEAEYELGKHISWDDTLLHLYFQKEEDAMKFMEFASTGMFIVNGYHLHPSWVPRSGIVDTEDYLCYHEKDSHQSLETMGGPESARRVLVLKKPVLAKSKLNSHVSAEKKRPSYPDPILNYSSDFDLNGIREDFDQFGPIVEILPVVSRKLCFAVQYFDVQSAIAAKHAIQTKGELAPGHMSVKYKDWYIWYGRDPADKPALFV
ncbi:hypothetical protein OGAPHI_001925 [Ogataea philodendri]|uniref:RRM domain-containing protein n=1 Tax=Ogataea philodendri TaxID=1378263 RepID=A0A9P8PAH5_9ASCO|nr:uncharacterized protein OGAPHI_001925 [Ogataea philodendri]KAH3668171.1 hypothetical protein OGAPHI_001925 [Ogataea philodendri]